MKNLIDYSRFFLIVTIIALIFAPSVFKGQAIILSSESINDFSIVVYNEESAIQKKAAKELQHYLNLIFNVRPKILHKKRIIKGGQFFLLGEGFLTDSLNRIDTLPKDAFIKAFHHRNIYLGGKDDLDVKSVKEAFFTKKEKANLGTLYATYDFLESELGVHWFFPTYLGEYVPKKNEFTLEEITSLIVPAIQERTFGIKYLYFDKDTAMTWLIRNKAGISNLKLYNHNWRKVVPPSDYFDNNPELFAEVDGEHRKYENSNKYAQFCTSNDELVNLFIEQSKDYLKKHPSSPYLSLSPNDNKKFCECSNCLELDTHIALNPTYSRLSNRIFTFYNRVADSIWKDYPNVLIGGYAYKEYAVATEKNKLPNDFHIRLAINNFGFGNNDCSTLDTLFLIIQSWKNKNNTGFYSFPYGNTWVYPYLRTTAYQKLIAELEDNNFSKIRFTFYPDWYTQGLDIWLITKILWNPEINVDSLKTIYYQSVYPQSHFVIQQFHNKLQQNIDRLEVCIPTFSSAGINRTRKIFLELFTIEMITETKKQLELKLLSKKLSDKEKSNISNFLKMIDFLEIEQKSYSSSMIGRFVVDRKSKSQALNKILSLKRSLILSENSKYWDSKKSPSFYIQK